MPRLWHQTKFNPARSGLDRKAPSQGSTRETEDYQVNLGSVSVLELALKPDLTPTNAFATLASWRMM